MQKLTCILLVDDDQTNNYLNKLLLSRLQITGKLLVALNGQEALTLVEEHCREASPACPALILLDVKMPVMNGFEFLEAYRQLSIPQRHAIIIVMLTTSLHPQDLERMQELRVDGFLSKPLTKEKVQSVLETYFSQRLQ